MTGDREAIAKVTEALAATVKGIGGREAIVKAVAVLALTAREAVDREVTGKVIEGREAIVKGIGDLVAIAKAVAVRVAIVWEVEAASQVHLVRVHGNQRKADLVVGHEREGHVQVDRKGRTKG